MFDISNPIVLLLICPFKQVEFTYIILDSFQFSKILIARDRVMFSNNFDFVFS